MILVLRALGLGDLATAVPAIRGLRTAYPAEPLALAAPAGLTPLIDLIGGVSSVVDTPGLDARLPGDLHPSLAVNLHGCGPESHRLLQAAEPGRLWAFANAEAGHLDGPPWIAAAQSPRTAQAARTAQTGSAAQIAQAVQMDRTAQTTVLRPAQTTPHPGWEGSNVAERADKPALLSTGQEHVPTGQKHVPTGQEHVPTREDHRSTGEEHRSAGEEHEVARWCRLLHHYGVPADQEDLGLAVPKADVPKGVTIIHPGAKSGTRRWPPDRFASVARALRADGHTVVVTASAEERPLAVRVAEAAGLDAGAVPETGLAELAALVAHARLLISGDTGIAHLATAYGTPSVTLFGPMSPVRWGPPPRPYHRALWHGTRSEPGDRPGPPHPALLAIGEKEVLEAAAEALG